MSDFSPAISFVMKNEGLIANEKFDKGGLTNHGLSFTFLKSIAKNELKSYGIDYENDEHLKELIRSMKSDTANTIYREKFWKGFNFDKIFYQKVCNYFFDMCVNMGHGQATKLVQRAIWAFDCDMKSASDDGIFGSRTLEKINIGGLKLLPPMISERANFYRILVAKDSSQEIFLKGWLARAYQ